MSSKNPHIGDILIHETVGIRFENVENNGTRWLNICFLGEGRCGAAHVSIFYGGGLKPDAVRRAMTKYIEASRLAECEKEVCR